MIFVDRDRTQSFWYWDFVRFPNSPVSIKNDRPLKAAIVNSTQLIQLNL
ncbi:MAG: hypothetical protein HC780_23450 [Leptolyngbyaceae cyanobacterium CSU_1_3]|nr:hypothetical protein [Leptolyngbyaceae cyanobacterium CSU_1_3]